MNLFNKQPPEERFWSWIKDNADGFKALKGGSSPLVEKFQLHLSKVHKDLVFELGRAADGVFEIIISADGIREIIPHVQKLVRAAPSIPGIRIHAFRQREPGLMLRFQGREMSNDSVFFTSQPSGNHLDLWLFVDGLDHESERSLMHACFLLLDKAIGEYDVMTKIGQIEFAPLIQADGRQRPLSELAEVVDAMKAS